MNSLALLVVDLRMAKGRFLRVFDVVDEKCTVRTPNSKMTNVREAGLARCETSLGVRRSMALISGKRLEIQIAAPLSIWAPPRWHPVRLSGTPSQSVLTQNRWVRYQT